MPRSQCACYKNATVPEAHGLNWRPRRESSFLELHERSVVGAGSLREDHQLIGIRVLRSVFDFPH